MRDNEGILLPAHRERNQPGGGGTPRNELVVNKLEGASQRVRGRDCGKLPYTASRVVSRPQAQGSRDQRHVEECLPALTAGDRPGDHRHGAASGHGGTAEHFTDSSSTTSWALMAPTLPPTFTVPSSHQEWDPCSQGLVRDRNAKQRPKGTGVSQARGRGGGRGNRRGPGRGGRRMLLKVQVTSHLRNRTVRCGLTVYRQR